MSAVQQELRKMGGVVQTLSSTISVLLWKLVLLWKASLSVLWTQQEASTWGPAAHLVHGNYMAALWGLIPQRKQELSSCILSEVHQSPNANTWPRDYIEPFGQRIMFK